MLLVVSVAAVSLCTTTTAYAQKNKVRLSAADKPNTPLYVAGYDRRVGKLNLVFSYKKVLTDPKHNRARHIDSFTVGKKVYQIELHADDGPKRNGRFLYNRNTVQNKFSVFIGKNRNLSKGLKFTLNDHPSGGGRIYTVTLK